MKKVKVLLLSFIISLIAGMIFLGLVFYIIIKLFPPVDREGNHHMAIGQIGISLLLSVIFVFLISVFIYKKLRAKKI